MNAYLIFIEADLSCGLGFSVFPDTFPPPNTALRIRIMLAVISKVALTSTINQTDISLYGKYMCIVCTAQVYDR